MKQNFMKRLAVVVATFAMTCSTAFATDNLSSSTIGTGINNIVSDINTFMMILCPIIGSGAATTYVTRKTLVDEQEGKSWQKRAIAAVLGAVLGILPPAIISLITGYFQ